MSSAPSQATDQGVIKVSVVVPVYNPGAYLDRCVESMLSQSMPSSDFEVVFVDDGSTDETPTRLDELARVHSNFRVIHIPNSGWPGKPRNVGTSEARGEYVQYLDQDDAMAPEALERLYAMGIKNRADIVIGKIAGNFGSSSPAAYHAIRGVPSLLFRFNREACTIYDAPLIDSLTPHKMLRTAFLREKNILFPEGRRRLEDQFFMVSAYFAAATVSVLSDYVCYFYTERDDRGNAGSVRIDPAGYYENLGEVLDVVIASTQPGDFRDRLVRRFLRVEMLGRLSEPSFQRQTPEFRARLFDAIRKLADERVGRGSDAGLGAVMRLRIAMVRDDRPDSLLTLAERCHLVRARPRIEAAEWSRGSLLVTVRSRFETAPDRDLVLLVEDDRLYLDPGLTEGVSDPLDVTDEVRSLKLALLVRERLTGTQWPVPAKVELELHDVRLPDGRSARVPSIRAAAQIWPLGLAAGSPLDPGTYDLWIRMSGLGLDRWARLGSDGSSAVDSTVVPALVGGRPSLVTPLLDAGGLSFAIASSTEGLGSYVGRVGADYLPSDGREIWARLPVASSTDSDRWPVQLGIRTAASDRPIGGFLEAVGDRVVLRAPIPSGLRVPIGSGVLAAWLDGPDGAPVELGPLTIERGGRVYPQGARRISRWSASGRRVRTKIDRWLADARRVRARIDLRRAARRFYRRVPSGARRWIGRLYWSARGRLSAPT